MQGKFLALFTLGLHEACSGCFRIAGFYVLQPRFHGPIPPSKKERGPWERDYDGRSLYVVNENFHINMGIYTNPGRCEIQNAIKV